MQKIEKFKLNIDVISNGLEKYMSFTINRDLVFIESMQFMNGWFRCVDQRLST